MRCVGEIWWNCEEKVCVGVGGRRVGGNVKRMCVWGGERVGGIVKRMCVCVCVCVCVCGEERW